ncbi:MAG TPA: phytanoyl-CoA dioxygenase family protein [Mycobacteriales bacterium]|jgi:ectoine hydroxylase-related dioxygenase (phytanoyl-CoA dioxygenase family)|nr:phytanoyl-CoA dioxygenase family protein [Mycobacteriales bacterium]
MLTEQQVARFQTDGFVKGERALDDVEVDALRAEMERVIGERDRADVPQPVQLSNLGTEDRPVWQIVNIWQASKPYADLIRNPRITEEIAQLTEAAELRIWHDQIQYKPAQQGGTNTWHQDAPLWPVLRPNTQVTAWVALDDVDVSNGCMSMVPGSHRWGDQMAFLRTAEGGFELPGEYEGKPVEIVSRPVAKGEVHYHHSLTWHGSHNNTSGRPRRAIAIHLMGGDTEFVASGNHPMKKFVAVADGRKLEGDAFPVVYRRPA